MRWLGYKFLFMCSDSGICCTCLLLAGSLASSFMNQLTLIHSPTARVNSAITCGL